MKMAVEDFYAVNSGYSTRISLHLRDSGGDAFGAASAAIDLLNNVQVKAIIGPQKSSQASFVMELGDRAHVPIISFSAKSPSLTPTQSSYFMRTAYNDSTQAKAIASIIQEFNWREVVPVYVDDEYGNGIMPYLINSFQHIDVRVPYRSSIPPSATKNQILKELYKLKEMQTRVFIVHMTCDLGLKLFTIAKDEGMLKEGYVWITTYGLTDIVNLLGSPAANVMQGVLGVRPFVNMTSKLRDFKQRWRKIFHQENPHSAITEPTVFGLWAYDTVWSLALAAEKVRMDNFTFQVPDFHNSSNDIASIGLSSVGPRLLQSIESIEFVGMAGKFHLIDGQLESQDFEILNVVKNGTTRVGFWAPPHNISGRRNSKDKLDVIIWPGETKGVPKGWEWPTAGKKLRIGVPVKPGFPEIIGVEVDPHSKKRIPKGYCIDVFEAVMKNLSYAPYEFILYEDNHENMNGTYDDLVYQVYLQAFPKNSPLVSEVSSEILKLLESNKMVDIEDTLYGNRSCPTQEENDTNSSSLSFRSFWGLFLITGVASMACLVLYLAYFLYKHREFLQTLDPENSIWRKLFFLAKLYDQMESPDAKKTTEAKEEQVGDATIPVDVMTNAAVSGPQTPSSISNHPIETSESEEEIEASSDEEETTGREISRQNPDPPSFADMLTARDQSDA